MAFNPHVLYFAFRITSSHSKPYAPYISLLIASSLLLSFRLQAIPTAAATDGADWTTYGRTSDEQRFSPLTQINEQTVGRLGLVWSRELGTTHGLEATPLVSNGVIYTTSQWSVAYAMDARTGEILWTFDPKVSRANVRTICCDTVNRGAALYHGKVYLGTLDGRLIALDAKRGKPVWDVVTVDQSKPYAITGAPRIVKGMVLIGNAGGEFGVRGYLSAYDAENGKLIWRTYTVPGDPAKGFETKALEAAAKTWHGPYWVAGGGGTIWDSIVYDPKLDLVYAGTGNGSTWYRDLRSPGGGDNLYLASILAFRAGDGQLVWHYQVTPQENWDYDATQPLMLADLNIAGTPRKVIMQASKNGFFYVIDRETGAFISAKPFVDGVTWATGIDPRSGRPIESAAAYDGLNPVLVSPAPGGAHNWYPMAFNPTTGLVYLPARQGFLRTARSGQRLGLQHQQLEPWSGRHLPRPAPGQVQCGSPYDWAAACLGSRPAATGVAGFSSPGRERWSPRDRGQPDLPGPLRRSALRLSRNRRQTTLAVRRRHRDHGSPGHLSAQRSAIRNYHGWMGRFRGA